MTLDDFTLMLLQNPHDTFARYNPTASYHRHNEIDLHRIKARNVNMILRKGIKMKADLRNFEHLIIIVGQKKAVPDRVIKFAKQFEIEFEKDHSNPGRIEFFFTFRDVDKLLQRIKCSFKKKYSRNIW